MGDMNRVTVLVYGQEYTLAGDMPRDYVLKLADKVDETMQRYIAEKDQQIEAVSAELAEQKRVNESLRSRAEELQNRVAQIDNAPLEAQKKIEELETRCRDIESSFFDIQMENIRLKNELENYKNRGY